MTPVQTLLPQQGFYFEVHYLLFKWEMGRKGITKPHFLFVYASAATVTVTRIAARRFTLLGSFLGKTQPLVSVSAGQPCG